MALTFSFNHIALSVKDVDESIQFYKNVLELEEVENTASDSKTRWLSLNEGKQLHLIPRPDAEVKINKAIHFALATSNLDRIIAKLENLKIFILTGKMFPIQFMYEKMELGKFTFKTQMGIG